MLSPVDQIKSRLGIVDVVSSYLRLERAGSQLRARCPFHQEKTPSFFVSPARDTFHCFGCGRGGDIFTFVESIEGISFPEALRLLAERAGVSIQGYKKEGSEKKERLKKILEEACVFYQKVLAQDVQARNYLKSRGVSEESIKTFRIGYARASWDDFVTYSLKRGFNIKEVEEVGLVLPRKTGMKGGYYDRFRGRIMFPVTDMNGKVIGFSARLFPDKDNEAKYINTPQTPLYDKSSALYGFSVAKEAIRTEEKVILVEGQMDVIASYQAGIKAVVAASGTALTRTHLMRLVRLAHTLVIAFDGDSAGFRAAVRAAEIAVSLGFDVRVVLMPEGDDPADLACRDPRAWKTAIDQAQPVMTFLINRMISHGDRFLAQKDLELYVFPVVAAMENKISQAHAIYDIAQALGIPESAVNTELLQFEKKHADHRDLLQNTERVLPEEQKKRRDVIFEKLRGIMLWQKTKDNPTVDVGKLERQLDKIFLEWREVDAAWNESFRNKLIFEAEMWHKEDKNIRELCDDLLANLEEEILKKKITEAVARLREAERENDEEKAERSMRLFNDLTLKLQNVKKNRNEI